MSKRFLFYAICVLTVIVILPGCAKNNADNNAPANQNQANGQQATNENKPDNGTPIGQLFNNSKQVENLTYTENMNMAGQNIETTVYIKGKNMRRESAIAGQKTIMIVDQENNVIYTYYPDQKMAMKMVINQNGQQESIVDMGKKMNNECKQIGSEKIDGKNCIIMQCQIKNSDNSITNAKMWMWDEYAIALKYIITGTDGSQTTITASNISTDSISDELFKLPIGVQIINADNLIK